MISLFYCFDRSALLSSSVAHHIQKFQFISINSNFIVIFSSAGFIENSFVAEFRRMFIASPFFFFNFYFSSFTFLPYILYSYFLSSSRIFHFSISVHHFSFKMCNSPSFFFFFFVFRLYFPGFLFFFYPATLSRHYVSQAKFPSGTPTHTHTHAVHIIRKPHIELQRAIPLSLVSFFLPLLRLSSFAV